MDTLSLVLLGVVALGSLLQGAFLIAVAVTGRQVSERGTSRPGAVSLSTGTGRAARLFAISWFWVIEFNCSKSC